MRKILGLLAFAGFGLATSMLSAQIVGFEDFDGGAINLTSGFTAADNLDDGGGDWYGIGSLGAWPQTEGVPFSLFDDSAANAGDLEGTFGVAADQSNIFFGISDARDAVTNNGGPLVASWVFDVTSAQHDDFQISIDMGQQSDGDAFGGISTADILFEVSVDGGVFQTVFDLDATTNDSGFVFRAMDDGGVANAVGVVEVVNAGVTKIEADTGVAAGNTILNKTPASGNGAGLLDTFVTDFSAAGASSVELRMTTTSFEFEAMAFDNITLTAVPEPGSLAFLACGALAVFSRRRRKA